MEPIFISYRSTHKERATQIRDFLESHDHQCKMAPRDIPPGENYSGWIMRTIRHCRALVLVASEDINTSENILSEIRQAFDNKVTIIPFCMEDTTLDHLSDDFQYYLGIKHAITDYSNFEDGLHQLLGRLDKDLEPAADDETVQPEPDTKRDLDRDVIEKQYQEKTAKLKIGIAVLAALCIFLTIGILVHTFLKDAPDGKSEEEKEDILQIYFWKDEITLAPGESISLKEVMCPCPFDADLTDIDYSSTNRAVAYVKAQEPEEEYRFIVVPADWKEENGSYADITAGIGAVASINSKGEPGGVRVTVQSTLSPTSGKPENQRSDDAG